MQMWGTISLNIDVNHWKIIQILGCDQDLGFQFNTIRISINPGHKHWNKTRKKVRRQARLATCNKIEKNPYFIRDLMDSNLSVVRTEMSSSIRRFLSNCLLPSALTSKKIHERKISAFLESLDPDPCCKCGSGSTSLKST